MDSLKYGHIEAPLKANDSPSKKVCFALNFLSNDLEVEAKSIKDMAINLKQSNSKAEDQIPSDFGCGTRTFPAFAP